MDSAKPSLDLVRSVTDVHVLRALMRHRRLTRAELAAQIGISKPTAGESVRRLTERGLVADTGERTPGGRGRGRVGSYYALAPAVGVALAVTIAPEGVVAECLDVYGDALARTMREVDRPARPDHVAAALRSAAAEVRDAADHPVRATVVSAADPVDRATGRLVQLPDAPFLVGELDPVAVLAPFAGGPVVVDNDVNWAASAERDSAGAEHLRDFAYLYLGEGLGCAIVNDGEIRRGRSGLTGEIAHLVTAGPGGRAVRFIELFGELGLRRHGSTAIDVGRLLGSGATTREVIGTAVAGVVAAVIALADPQEVVVGGSWGPALLGDIGAATARLPRHVPVRATALTGEPVMAGVRAAALDHLRASVTADG
ncbi:ROK family transcriptional regulator [Actinoplanes aureus]|jgi:predicted NBD/HSP70 family sugar kinase|uniref:ROK family transcriptional regulator n=1 Tax=Actinoplanes aureus TaxID=2792083 RepID=A0A931CBJ4_9ACTN|nr:ROK family transcriptional regulator [Actinoplanes aureus]MBG0564113.1 ROK family transcriptional regulator [Actinoplanes aureus]